MALKPFPKGVSGNPAGRTPGSKSHKTLVQEAFINMMQKDVDGRPFFDVFNETFVKSALDPNSSAFRFLSERLYAENILDDIDAQINKSRREDADFMTYRVHRLAFDQQQRVLLSQSRDIGIMAGRRAGKTITNILKTISKATEKNNARCLTIGLTVMKTTQIYWDDTIRMLTDLGIEHKSISTDSRIELTNGSFIQFGGNSNKVEREKYRGQHWDLIIIDEAQSQAELGSFIREIINPMLMDTNGVLMLTGSGPRTRGTYWERFFTNPSPSGLRMNWNLSSNPNIHNYQKALEEELEKQKLTESDPIWMREYLGLIVYDDDALVYRLSGGNYYTDDEMLAWLDQQSPEDVKFTAGLDFGFRDSDAFVIVMYSEKSNEKWIVYEYKQSGTDVTTLCDAIKQGKEYIKTDSKFSRSYHRDFDIFADTSDQKISMELSHRYGIPVHNAIKYDKAMAIQNLQDEVKRTNLKVKRGSEFDQESLMVIFKRTEIEGQPSVITREIDDEVYHPDTMDAILYSLRYYWLTHNQNHAIDKVTEQANNEQDAFLEAQSQRRGNELF